MTAGLGLGCCLGQPATGFPEGSWGSWAGGMFYTRQALEKQTQRWALCPLSRRGRLHTRSSVCLLFDKSAWICISVPWGQSLGQSRAGPTRERACVCVGVCVCVCVGVGIGPKKEGPCGVWVCVCICVSEWLCGGQV